MSAALSYPGVYIEEVSSGVRTISGVATSIALFIGWAPRGDTKHAVRLTSFADYEREYGGLDTRSYLGYAVKQFYDNGGVDAYVVRIADATAVSGKTSIDDLEITASSPGAWAAGYKLVLKQRADEKTRFRLTLLEAKTGNVVESFENLSMTKDDPRFVEDIVKDRSSFITVVAKTTAPPKDTVDEGVSLDPSNTGNDGTVLDPGKNGFQTQLTALFEKGGIADRIDLFNIVCVPALVHAGTISTLQAKCQQRRAFLLVDCKVDDKRDTVTTSNITADGAKNSAIFFPWVRAPDPKKSGALRAFPPCGFAAGIFARTDATRGVWKAPAGTDAGLTGAAGLVETLSDLENGQLNPKGINCLRSLPVYGNVVWGSRTLHGDNDRASEWKYIPVRRMALFLEESLYRGTQWVVFEPNDEPLWAQIRLNIGAFMHNLFQQQAFQGTSPRDAYFVRCDRTTTTQTHINLGIVNIIVGFAPLKPAEFVVIKLQQIAGDIPT